MGTWTKHHTRYYTPHRTSKPRGRGFGGAMAAQDRWESYLPEVYEGMNARREKYIQYDQMDFDSEVNMALGILAGFSTQQVKGSPFHINWKRKNGPGPIENTIVNEVLDEWMNLNELDRRLWRLFRSTLKFGDQFFIRDPQTFKLHWVSPKDVVKIGVDPVRRKPISYWIKNLKFNTDDMVASDPTKGNHQSNPNTMPNAYGPDPRQQFGGSSVYEGDETAVQILAQHVVHFTLSEGYEMSWPFGQSILDPVYKVFKQKEMLEDAILIYRIQRAPERRVFYIETGDMPPAKAGAYLEKIKNSIHQRRIPNRQGGSRNITDSTYNPQSIMEDLWFTTSGDGRGSKVDVLPGGDNLGEIDDLKYFSLKMLRGMGIPGSYLPSNEGDGNNNTSVADGKMNNAFVQEFVFSEYCRRLQNAIVPVLDREFKMYLMACNTNIETSNFKLQFHEPMNFSKYRQIELEGSMLQAYGNLLSVDTISDRIKFKKYLGWTDEDIYENEKALAEEWRDKLQLEKPRREENAGLESVGLPGGGMGEVSGGPPGGDPGGEGAPGGGEEMGGPDTGGDSGGADIAPE